MARSFRMQELPTWRRRVARLGLTVAAIIDFLMLMALPMDAFVFAGAPEEHVALVVLVLVLIGTIWGHVALARRRPYGRVIALALAAYALVMVIRRGFALASMQAWADESILVGSLLVSGVMCAGLIAAGLACLPRPAPREHSAAAPAV